MVNVRIIIFPKRGHPHYEEVTPLRKRRTLRDDEISTIAQWHFLLQRVENGGQPRYKITPIAGIAKMNANRKFIKAGQFGDEYRYVVEFLERLARFVNFNKDVIVRI